MVVPQDLINTFKTMRSVNVAGNTYPSLFTNSLEIAALHKPFKINACEVSTPSPYHNQIVLKKLFGISLYWYVYIFGSSFPKFISRSIHLKRGEFTDFSDELEKVYK